MGERFGNDDFQFGFEVVLGSAFHGGADAGEVLATAARIADGDADSWVDQWTATAGRAWAAARAAAGKGHRVSARSYHRRAASYYATALRLVECSSEPERHIDLWRRQRECWDRVVDLADAPGERLRIPYEGTALPGYFFRAPGAVPGERRPLVVLNNGGDGATSQMPAMGGTAAGERGYHWMTFDGPGQQAALFELGMPYRCDWEAVLTPVVDAMVGRGDVDPGHMAVIGVGQAGFWVTRALSFEHRLAAAVVDPGVVDVSASWTAALPEAMRRQLELGQRAAFDREMHLTELLWPAIGATLSARGAPYGVESDSRYALFETVSGYRLGEEVAEVTTPLLITEYEHEQFWPGQSQDLHDRLEGPRELLRFTADEGASRHGCPLAPALRETRIFDWLERYLAGDGR